MNIISGPIQRVWVDFLLFLGLISFFFMRPETWGIPQTLQLVFYKMLLVSTGFLHAHIMRKLAFPSVSWISDDGVDPKVVAPLKYLTIGIYVIVIWAYARGG